MIQLLLQFARHTYNSSNSDSYLKETRRNLCQANTCPPLHWRCSYPSVTTAEFFLTEPNSSLTTVKLWQTLDTTCRQTHSTLITPIRKFKRNWMHLKKAWAQPYTNKLEQFGGRESKWEKQRTPWRNMCSDDERMLIHQASQTNMTLHNLFWKAEKKI